MCEIKHNMPLVPIDPARPLRPESHIHIPRSSGGSRWFDCFPSVFFFSNATLFRTAALQYVRRCMSCARCKRSGTSTAKNSPIGNRQHYLFQPVASQQQVFRFCTMLAGTGTQEWGFGRRHSLFFIKREIDVLTCVVRRSFVISCPLSFRA